MDRLKNLTQQWRSPPTETTRILRCYKIQMLTFGALNTAKHHIRNVVCQRNLGIAAPMLNKVSDPIQQLFIDKIREYGKKSGGGNKLVDPTPEIQKELSSELERITKVYGGGSGTDMTKFPTFKFIDPVIDPINLEQK